ncbi:hypothetical protein LLG96_06265 [bacterium]|nr:hypothetical protein [bacterium]
MSMNKGLIIILWMIVCFVGFGCYGPNRAEASDLRYGAALRQNVLLFRRPAGTSGAVMPDHVFGISQSTLRVYEDANWRTIALSTAVETRMNFFSSGSGMFGLTGGGGSIFGSGKPLERWDATFDHVEENTASMQTRLERLDLSWSLGSYDFHAGRQPVSLGTSHFIGVLDVVAPFAPGDLDATYKPGVDALRIRRPVGMKGEAEVIAIGGRPWEYGALLGRFRSSVKGIDLELVGGRFRKRGFGGIGWEGGVGDYGIWGELALFERKKNEEAWRGGWSEAAFSGVAGVDFNLPSKIKMGGALMFQDFGVRDPGDLAFVYQDAPFREGWAFLASAGYGLVTLHRQLHPLVNADCAGLINLVDGSTLWQPMLTVSAGNNADISLYGWIGAGEKNTVRADGITMRSEFGSLPTGAGFYARWFF